MVEMVSRRAIGAAPWSRPWTTCVGVRDPFPGGLDTQPIPSYLCSSRGATAERIRRGDRVDVNPCHLAAPARRAQQRQDRLLQAAGRWGGSQWFRRGDHHPQRHHNRHRWTEALDRISNLGSGGHQRRRRAAEQSDHRAHPRGRYVTSRNPFSLLSILSYLSLLSILLSFLPLGVRSS